MNKKQIAAFIDELVAEVADKGGLNENEARALVGIAIKRKRAELVTACVPETVEIETAV